MCFASVDVGAVAVGADALSDVIVVGDAPVYAVALYVLYVQVMLLGVLLMCSLSNKYCIVYMMWLFVL